MTETEQLKELYRRSFDDSQSYLDFFFQNKYDGTNAVALREEGRIVSALYLLDKGIRIGKVRGACPFISAAATLPAYRGRGRMGEVLRAAFSRVRGEGGAAVALYPFSHAYYERFGFVTYSFVRKVRLNFFRQDTPYRVTEAGEAQAPVLARLYEDYTRGFGCVPERGLSGMKDRLAELWADGGRAALITKDGAPSAYALFDPDEPGEAEEFVAPDGEVAHWFAAADGVDCFLPAPRGVPFGMLRCVNAVALLAAASFSGISGEISLEVTDSFFPENCGKFAVAGTGFSVLDGAAACDASLSVADFTRCALGLHAYDCGEVSAFFLPQQHFLADKY